MPELIERHALLKKVYEHPQERERMTDGEWCRKCIYEAPTIEPELKKGHINICNGFECCSECGKCLGIGYTNYCGYCGAELEV